MENELKLTCITSMKDYALFLPYEDNGKQELGIELHYNGKYTDVYFDGERIKQLRDFLNQLPL